MVLYCTVAGWGCGLRDWGCGLRVAGLATLFFGGGGGGWRGTFFCGSGRSGAGGAGFGGLGMSGCWVCVCGLTLEEGGVVRVGMGWDIVVKDLGVCLYGRVFFELFCEGWGAGERERKGQMGFGFVRWWERVVGHTFLVVSIKEVERGMGKWGFGSWDDGGKGPRGGGGLFI